MNKKGVTETQFLFMFNLILAAIVISMLISYVYRSATFEGFKEKQKAIDSALLLNAVYSAPNDILAIYGIEDPNFYVKIEDYNVRINERTTLIPGESYPYARNLYIKQEFLEEDSGIIVIEKQDNQIKISKG